MIVLHTLLICLVALTCIEGAVLRPRSGFQRLRISSPQNANAPRGADLEQRESVPILSPRQYLNDSSSKTTTQINPAVSSASSSWNSFELQTSSQSLHSVHSGSSLSSTPTANAPSVESSSYFAAESSSASSPTANTPSSVESSAYFAADMMSKDIFSEPIDTKAPPSSIAVRHDHPVPRAGIKSSGPFQTNKFYSNFFLGNRLEPTFTFPYSVAWSGGKGPQGSWGMACSHIDASQRIFGKEKYNGAASYFVNPVGIQSLIISAKELSNSTQLSMDSLTAFSTRVHLSKDKSSPPTISFPLVQGMAYVTSQFNGGTPMIQSGVYFKTMTRATKDTKENVSKFTFKLEDGTTWHLYAWHTKGDALDLKVVNNGVAASSKPFYGIIQVGKDPGTNGAEGLLDDGAAIYPVTVKLSGSVADTKGTYKFTFEKDGHQSGNLYMFALPHHIDSLNDDTKKRLQKVSLQTTTKGIATLIKGTDWTMVEPEMPVKMGFAPWDPSTGNMNTLSAHAKDIIKSVAAKEIAQNMTAQTNLDSMYFSGKALAKFGSILYVINDMLGDKALAQTALGQLKAAFGTFAASKQKFPLVLETAWGGIVSSATYVTGDPGVDFGNTYYNDHHFHYGYHILAAALIGHLDPEWAKQNKDYVNILVRDVANPSAKDNTFPMWRNFDWYHGHSWAHGLYAAADGKDQESSSEDVMHAYAIKMWGKVIGNADMEARGNLQLSIIARSLQHYYLYQNDNKVQPKQFMGNKVAGILFENKIDHTTYFDANIEAIQGIHMIPILPSTPLVRLKTFVKEEWEAFFSNGRIDGISNAWKGIVYASYTTVDPKKAWDFFSSKQFDSHWLDGGASLTWSLAYAAALGKL